MPELVEPFTVPEVKARLGIRHAERDAEIADLIPAARGKIETWTGKLLVRRSVTQYGSVLGRVLLHKGPVVSVTRLEHTGWDGVPAEVVGVRFQQRGGQYFALPPIGGAWPNGGHGFEVEYVAGYAADAIPAELSLAMLLLISHWFENKEAVVVGTSAVELPLGVRTLCEDFRDDPGIS